MKKYIIILIAIVLNRSIYAQQAVLNDSSELNNYAFQLLTGEKYNDPGYKFLNIYFKDYWIPGKVILSDGQQVSNLSLKYNGFTNQLVMLSNKVGQIKIDNQAVSEFYLYDKEQTCHFINIAGSKLNLETDVFCQFIFSGKIDLYVYRRIKPNAISYRDNGMFQIYASKPIYVLFINNKTILFNQATQKAIYIQFPYLKEQIQQKTRHHKKIKNENDFFIFLKEIEDILVGGVK